jgi:glycosyltransferase involved in cell wall biosynthesis
MVFASNNHCSEVNDLSFISYNELKKQIFEPTTCLIYHHSMYWKEGEDILLLANCIKILKYHNITPSKFFEKYSENYFNATHIGEMQTKRFIENEFFDFLSADSEFNKQGLLKYAKTNTTIEVIPPFTKIIQADDVKLNLDIVQSQISSEKVKVLFVGRFAPNKGIHHLVRVIKSYSEFIDQNIILRIVGNVDPQIQSYYDEVRQYVIDNNLSHLVSVEGKLSFVDLVTYYKTSDVFLLCSEHEGFCVPILEAQHARLPIMAYHSSAIKDTLGENQLGFQNMNYLKLAIGVKHVAKNTKVKLFLTNAGVKNLQRFTDESIRLKTIKLIQQSKREHV